MARAGWLLRAALGVTAFGALSAASVEDTSVLVQSAVRSHEVAAATSQRAELLRKLASGQLPPAFLNYKFDCKASPRLCEAPFFCDSFTPMELAKIPIEGLAPDGKPNLRLWCIAPMYQNYMATCLADKDLVKAAKVQFEWSLNQHNGVDEADGSYCFIEGHCSNTAVTNETTLEESVQMCDDRYGRTGWAAMGRADQAPKMLEMLAHPVPLDLHGGFHDAKTTTVFLKAACAMGNYHCDVVYCKETYCKNPHYVQRYGHLLPKAPGHLLQAKDWLE